MRRNQNITISSKFIPLAISKYSTGSLRDAKRSGRKSKLENEHVNFIDNALSKNDELISKELSEKLSTECGIQISATTVRRDQRNVQGRKTESARYCQFVRDPNKVKWLVFALKTITEKIRSKMSFLQTKHLCKSNNMHGFVSEKMAHNRSVKDVPSTVWR